jgi:hypothetical protein
MNLAFLDYTPILDRGFRAMTRLVRCETGDDRRGRLQLRIREGR